jgi:hypothetical protein
MSTDASDLEIERADAAVAEWLDRVDRGAAPWICRSRPRS